MESMSRRSFVRNTAVATAALAWGGSLIGCAPGGLSSTESALFTAGTYTASAQGKNGPVTVEATFTDDALDSLRVVGHSETEGISDFALELMPQRILDSQSIEADVVSGATLTSMGIASAVKECARQAGGSAPLEKAVEKPAPTSESLEADVLVIGAGGAGLCAALAALDTGAEVLVVERQDMTGGSTRLNGAMFITEGNEEEKKELGALDADQTFQFFANNNDTEYFSPDLAKSFFNDMVPVYDYVEETCFAPGLFVNQCYAPFDPADPASEAPMMTQYWPADAKVDETGEFAGLPEGCGCRFVDPLEEAVKAAGGTILCGTSVTALEAQDGVVTGATAENRDNVTYTIAAKAVVIASGGYAANDELRGKWWGDENLEWFSAPSCDGACIAMAEKVGAKTAFVECPGGWGGGYATLGGLLVDDAMHVVDTSDASMENLFAIGEVANIRILGTVYPMSGTMNSWSVYSGQMAGENAAAAALGA